MKKTIQFADVATTLHQRGYDITPLHGKRPVIDDWAAIDANDALIETWLHQHAHANVGIQTRHTPAVDIDIYDADAAAEMEAWCLDNLSADALVRVGQAPKRLLLFRTDAPFKKMKVKFVDGDAVEHAIEVLGAGQQFVAFGVHPVTKRPFEWTTVETPLDVAVDDLPTLSRDDATRMLEAFIAMAQRRGWTRKGGKGVARAASSSDEDDEALLGIAGRADDLDDEDIRDALSLVDDVDDYDRWLTVGMALHHQYAGGDTGLELWHEWSEQGASYDADVLVSKWEGFSVVRSGGTPTTIATVLKWAKDGAKQKSKDEFERVKAMIDACSDPDELFDDITRKIAAFATLPHHIETAANLLQRRMSELTGVKMPISEIRKALMKKRGSRLASEGAPEWVSEFVWLESDDCFFSLADFKTVSIRSYNARYDRHLLTPEDKAMGVAVPATRATDAALTTYTMPHVDGKIYLPGADRVVQLTEGDTRVNIYDDRDVPKMRKAKTDEEKAALAAVQRHFETLFPDERERNLVISYLAYQVQQPSERVNWAMLIQGVEGAGKTWMQNLMASVLGPKNVGPVNPSSLFAPFNGWAEGRKMIFVEEIRLRGQDRFEVLEKIKTNITNDVIEITRKGRDPYSSPNVASYVMFTNYQDALSLSDNDRRYMILRTALQSKRQLQDLRRRCPTHFADIFRAVGEHGGVLRGWLMRWQLSADFLPKGDAPVTFGKEAMRSINLTDEQDTLIDMLASGEYLDCSEYLLNVTLLPSRFADGEDDIVIPKTSAMKAMLEQMGFTFLGRHRIGEKPMRYYTRRPDLFPREDVFDVAQRIRRIMAGEEPEFL